MNLLLSIKCISSIPSRMQCVSFPIWVPFITWFGIKRIQSLIHRSWSLPPSPCVRTLWDHQNIQFTDWNFQKMHSMQKTDCNQMCKENRDKTHQFSLHFIHCSDHPVSIVIHSLTLHPIFWLSSREARCPWSNTQCDKVSSISFVFLVDWVMAISLNPRW